MAAAAALIDYLLPPLRGKRYAWERYARPLVFCPVSLEKSGLFTLDAQLQTLVAVLTNFCGIPLLRWAWRKRLYFEAWVFFWLLITSTLYHTCDTFAGMKILLLNEGQWHRLDNVFSIVAFQAVFLHYCLCRSDTQRLDKYRWGLVTFALFCQEAAPWRVEMTLVPIAAAAGFALYARQMSPAHVRPAIAVARLGIGLAFLAVAVFCFARGLDEKADWLRLYHGGWHVFVAIGMTMIFQAVDVHVTNAPPLAGKASKSD